MNWIPEENTIRTEEHDGLDLRKLFVRAVRRSFGWVCLFAAAGAAIGLALGLMQPNEYVSNAKLHLRVGVRETLSPESFVNVDDRPQESRPTMADELAMLTDVALLERTARELGPGEVLEPADPRRDDGPLTPWHTRLVHSAQATVFGFGSGVPSHVCEGDACSTCVRAATKALAESTVVVNEPMSNVVRITHTSTSPEKAQQVTRALANTFIARHREQFSMQPLVDKHRGRLEQAKAERDAATEAYFQHVDQCGFVNLPTQSMALLTEIDTLERDLFFAKATRAENERQRASLKERLEGTSPNVEVVRPGVPVPNEEWETQLQLKRSLLQRRASLSTENRPIDDLRLQQRKIDDQIAQVEKKLATTPRTVMQSHDRREIVGPSALSVRIDELAVEDAALEVKTELLHERLVEKQERAKLLYRCEKDHAALISARDALAANYQHLLERFSVVEALGSDDFEQDGNLRLLQAPTLERDKIGPRRMSLLLKGLIGGLIVGLSVAMLRQRFDERTLDPESFARTRHVPVLGMVPDQPGLSRTRWARGS